MTTQKTPRVYRPFYGLPQTLSPCPHWALILPDGSMIVLPVTAPVEGGAIVKAEPEPGNAIPVPMVAR